jgi:hypothetical protein
MKKTYKGLVATCGLALGAVLISAPSVSLANDIKVNSWAVKFVCDDEVETEINVHNPRFANTYFLAKIAHQEGTSPYFYVQLRDDGVFAGGCDEFREVFQFSGEFEGYAVILSLKDLDVIATYEVESEEETEDFDVQVYTPTKVPTTQTNWNNLVSSANSP